MGYNRIMPQEVKQKISQSLTGRKLTPNHIQNISKGVKRAWERVPQDPNKIYNNNSNKNDYSNGTQDKNKI